jgi:oxygen-dependent protoporphyrinogen oxidase
VTAPPRVAVVGGGIAGIAAALDLVEQAEVELFEATDRLGGPVRTVDFAGARIEAGPDSFLARRPEMIELAKRLGLGDQLTPPTAGEAGIWSRGAVRTMPKGLVLGVPRELTGLARSGIVSRAGLLRAALDRVLPTTKVGDDVAMGEIVRKRFGREVQERLVDPLMGGVHAGRSDLLSSAVASPQLLAAARKGGSLMKALPATPPSTDPVFFTIASGLGTLVDAAVSKLPTVRLSTPVTDLRRTGSAWEVNGETFDGVILATHAPVTAQLLEGISPDAVSALATMTYSSVVLTLLAYPSTALAKPYPLTGYLVPRPEKKLTSAISWWNTKWAQKAPADTQVVRVSTGRIDDLRHRDLSDENLVGRLHAELRDATGLRADGPSEVRVNRYENALPQFKTDHLTKVAARAHAAAATVTAPLALAGSCYEGLGLPACVASGRAAAAALRAKLS